MSFSAEDRADADRLSRALELYRDLTSALRDRIMQLKASAADDPDCKNALDAVKAHNRVLQTVLDLEGSLGKRKKAWIDGAVCELDLAAARTEILAKLSRWATGG